MILTFILSSLIAFIISLFGIFPNVETLPFGMDEFLQSAVANFKYYFEIFPPFETIFTAFGIYVSFKLLVLSMKFFLGGRTPVSY